MVLLQELPDGITITKHSGSSAQLDDDDEWLDDPLYLEWLQALDKVLAPLEAPGGLKGIEDNPPEFIPSPAPKTSIWEVSYYDEHGEIFEETHVTLAEDVDLIRALIVAKNRLRAGRTI